MHTAGAGVERHVIAQQNDRVAIQERMPAEPFFHVCTRKNFERFADRVPAGFLVRIFTSSAGQDQQPFVRRVQDDEIPEPGT